MGSFGACPIFCDIVHVVFQTWLIVESETGLNLDLRGKSVVYIEYFLTVECSDSVWGHSVLFRFSPTLYIPVSRKRLIVERNGPKYGPHGYLVYIEYF